MNSNTHQPVERRQQLMAAALVFLGALCFSSKAVMVKLAYRHEVDSVSLLTLRMLFSLPFFLIIAYRMGRKSRLAGQKMRTADWLQILLFGILGYYAASMLDFWGLQYITASLERLVLFVYPTLVLIISAIFLGKRITQVQMLAVLITYIGITLAFAENFRTDQQDQTLWGALLIFGAALTYAIYLIGSGSLLPRLGTWRYTSMAMMAACAAVLIHHGIFHRWALFHFSAPVYQLSILMALFATVLPAFMVSEGIRIIGASNAAIIGSVGPISTIVLAGIFLGERLTPLQWLGTLIVIGGVLLITLKKGK